MFMSSRCICGKFKKKNRHLCCGCSSKEACRVNFGLAYRGELGKHGGDNNEGCNKRALFGYESTASKKRVIEDCESASSSSSSGLFSLDDVCESPGETDTTVPETPDESFGSGDIVALGEDESGYSTDLFASSSKRSERSGYSTDLFASFSKRSGESGMDSSFTDLFAPSLDVAEDGVDESFSDTLGVQGGDNAVGLQESLPAEIVCPAVLGGAVDDSRVCMNCRRLECFDIDGVLEYGVSLAPVDVDDIRFRVLYFLTFAREDCRGPSVLLCKECRAYLSKTLVCQGSCKKIRWADAWPSYFWQMISCEKLLREHGSAVLQFIPLQWRQYWVGELQASFPGIFPGETYSYYTEELAVVVVDITRRRRRMMEMKSNLKLGEMKQVCNELLMPLVLCPWGCTCYYHETGRCSIDSINARFFSGFHLSGRFDIGHVDSCRGDFLSPVIDCHLFNPDWKVYPSVYYEGNVGPVFKTCRDHDGGDQMQYFHLPRTMSSLPARHPECLAPAVLRSRTLKPCMPKAFSNEYKLQEMLASYCGVDTAVLTQQRQFRIPSHLEDIAECRSFFHRDDIKGLAQRLCANGDISSGYLDNLKGRSSLLFSSSDSDGVAGATVALLTDCINFQRVLRSKTVRNIIDDLGDRQQTVTFYPEWPESIFKVHPNDGYGCRPVLVRGFKPKHRMERDFWCLWLLCCLVVNVPEAWTMLDVGIQFRSDWQGNLLSFISREVLGGGGRGGGRGRGAFAFDGGPEGMCVCLHARNSRVGDLESILKRLFRREISSHALAVFNLNFNRHISHCFRVNHRFLHGASVVFVLKGILNRVIVEVEETIMVEDSEYELRFIGCVEDGSEGRWDGECWSRHGGLFQRWWRNTKTGRRVIKEETLHNLDLEKARLFVYVVKGDVDVDELRHRYLKYIGGQDFFFCERHDVPLVTSVTRGKGATSHQCSLKKPGGGTCKRQADLECPVTGCWSAVCRLCNRRIFDDGDCFYVNHDDSFIDESRGARAVSDGENCSAGNDEAEEEWDSSDEEDSGVDYSDLHQGLDQPLFDVEHCHDLQNGNFFEDDECRDEGVIATSHETKSEQNLDFDLGYMGTSVLLNKFGTVLVRRDNRLQATRKERNLVERVVSVKDMGSIPLVYLEGILFPSIFWCQPGSANGGLLGAIPTVLLCRHETRRKAKVASLIQHARVRLKSIGNTASTSSHYLSYLFDCLANGALEGNDTRVVIRRGFEESMKCAGMKMRNELDDLFTDTIDNRQNCHNLAASERDWPSTLFVTLTCNQKEHFGIQTIKNYIDSASSLENYKAFLNSNYPAVSCLSSREENEVNMALHEAARTLLVRNWMEVKQLLIDYMLNSKELPLGGKVGKIYTRDEYQGEAGNLSHIHFVVTLLEGYDTEHGRCNIQRAIRGFIDEIVGIDEVESFIDEGILENWDDYWVMKEHARRILPHSCSSHRCLRRVGKGSKELRCRVPDTRLLSRDITEFCESHIDIEHTNDAITVMERLGLCQDRGKNGGKFVPEREFLRAKRILAPVRYGEGNVTPVIGRIFAGCRSSMNVQVCTSYGTSRYLVKYITSIDENNYTVFSVKQGSEHDFKVEKVSLHNTKISSSAKNEQSKLNASRHRKRPRGRSIAQTEMCQIILGYPQIHTNIDFEKVPTVPLGDRAGFEQLEPMVRKERWFEIKRRRRANLGLPDKFTPLLAHAEVRKELFMMSSPHRCFTVSQEALLHDQLQSPVTLDRVTLFGGRPPELVCVDMLEWYFQFFTRSKRLSEEEMDNEDDSYFCMEMRKPIEQSKWIDGYGHVVKLRPSALPKLSKIVFDTRFLERGERNGCREGVQFLRRLCRYYNEVGLTIGVSYCERDRVLRTRTEEDAWGDIQENYLAQEERSKALPVVVLSNVRPKNATKFAIHVLLSMGHFVTESDLWSQPSLRDAFVHADIWHEDLDEISSEHCDRLLLRWITEQMQYYPITSKVMDDYICSADSILQDILLHDEIPINEIPPCLYTHLARDTSSEILAYKELRRATLVDAVLCQLEVSCRNGYDDLPTRDELIRATVSSPLSWSGSVPISDGQSEASYFEQNYVQDGAKRRIDEYLSCSMKATKNFLIVGPPGAGKTHCLLLSVVYALAKGLNGITTASLAERAFLLGGQHLHLLFKMRAREISGRPHRVAELAVIALQKKPEMLALMRSLDVLFVDEMGQVSADMLSVLDIILRRVRDSSLFMGGVLVIGTLDQVQLRPIKELPFLLSPYVLTTFKMGRLKHYVRCASCPVLQEINEIARFFTSDEELREQKLSRFASLVRDNCRFVSDWNDPAISDGTLRVFPKRKQASGATREYLQSKRREVLQNGGRYCKCIAKDTMVAMESHGDWQKASPSVITEINRHSSEPDEVHFFKNAVYQFTFNCPGKFNATQLGVLMDEPNLKDIKDMVPVRLLAAPPGTKVANLSSKTRTELIQEGWTEVQVGCAPEYTTTLWSHGVKIKRKQYGLKHHVASTVHCAIGHTVVSIATELSLKSGVWERAMVVVLVSRVRYARDIIFVGDKEDNIMALVQGLRIRCQYDEYMNHIVDSLSANPHRGEVPVVRLSKHPCRPRDITLPTDSSGCVYLLVGKDGVTLYVGFTQNLPKRINTHNTGYGSRASCNDRLRPWVLYAYVAGFGGDRSIMKGFEAAWQGRNQYMRPETPALSVNLALQLIEEQYKDRGFTLVCSRD